jgi:putative acyl-CoA dehydrogenase
LNSIWEGSGNVMCLDVLRALAKTPAVRGALADELAAARGVDRHYDAFVGALAAELDPAGHDEAQARRLTERIALAVQGSLLLAGGRSAVSDAFCASRLGTGAAGRTFGTLDAGIDFAPLLARALPG